jgi:hypothetical protein
MCEFVRLLYALVPLGWFRDYLIQKHLAVCPRCVQAWAEGTGLPGLVRPPDWISREASLWPRIEQMMAERAAAEPAPPRVLPRRPFAELAVAAGGVLAVAALALLLGRRAPDAYLAEADAARTPRIEVLSAEIEGRAARATLYQTERASFVWLSEGSR